MLRQNLVVLWVVLFFGFSRVMGSDEHLSSKAELALDHFYFEGLDLESQIACRRVMIATALRFQKLTGMQVGKASIHVRLAPIRSIEVPGLEAVSGAQGLCVVLLGRIFLTIPTRGSQPIAPILAHEATHAYVAEAYGQAHNLHLNEGLAQYLAGLEHPPFQSELRRVWLKGNYTVATSPYVAGFHFVEGRADHPRFMEFLKKYILLPVVDYDELERLWEQSGGNKPQDQ